MQGFQKQIITEKRNLWRYAWFYPEKINDKDQLEIETSFTPLEHKKGKYLKREDENISGSLKTRGLAYQLSMAKKEGHERFVISTSGNAGITAVKYLGKYGGDLIVVTSKNVPDRKIDKLKKVCKHLITANNPTHIANYISKKYSFKNLRPSRDLNSIPGYYSLGFETYEQMEQDIDNIFIYSSSGSSFIGLYESFRQLNNLGCISKLPKMYATIRENVINFRHKRVLEICAKTGGKEIIVNSKDFDSVDFDTSHEGRCSIFAAEKEQPSGNTVVYITGKKYEEINDTKNLDPTFVDTLEEVDNYIKSNFSI